jgi:hypothetical protein
MATGRRQCWHDLARVIRMDEQIMIINSSRLEADAVYR